eukprot:354246-Chlamydomonas_euryale.AAC.5
MQAVRDAEDINRCCSRRQQHLKPERHSSASSPTVYRPATDQLQTSYRCASVVFAAAACWVVQSFCSFENAVGLTQLLAI